MYDFQLYRLPLYLDPLPKTHFGPSTDSFTYCENLNDTDLDTTASLQTPQPNHSSGGDTTDSATNAEGSSLAVPQEEDKFSHGSRSSTAFATPKTGMTPTSSENEADSKDEKRWSGVSTEGSSKNSTLNRTLGGMDGQALDQSPQDQGAVVPTSSEGTRESNSLASISTPSLDRLQLPTVDRPLEKSDDHSCSTLTGSQGSLLLNDSAPKATNLQPSSTNGSLGPIGFNSKTATASPRVTKAVAKPTGVTDQDHSNRAYVSINNPDVMNGDGDHGWPAGDVVSSAAFTNRPSPPVSSSSAEKYPQQSTGGVDRIDSHEVAGAINGVLEEESHSAGSGSFSSTLVDTVNSSNHIHSPPPPYEYHDQHTVFNAHMVPSHDGHFPPYHSTINSAGVSTHGEQPPVYTSTGTSSNRSNGVVPRFEQADQKGKTLMPRQLSLADQERSSPEQYYSPMSRKFKCMHVLLCLHGFYVSLMLPYACG